MQPVQNSGLASLVVVVADETGTPLGEQAFVKLTSDTTQTQSWGTTHKRAEAQFDSLPPGDYEIEASAAGYATGRQSLYVMSGNQVYNVWIRLKGDGGGVGSGVMKPGQLLAPKAQKEAEKGLAALRSGHMDSAQKHMESAEKLAPTNADVKFLLGFLCERQKDPAKAEGYFVKATSLDPQNLRALTALGELREKTGDYPGAIGPLEKAVSLDHSHWQAHWILAAAYLHNEEFAKAQDEAEVAIKTGKGAANQAELILGEALAYAGELDKAIEAFQNFLREEPKDPAAPKVREMIAKLQSYAAKPGPAATSISLPILPATGPTLGTPAIPR